MSGSSQPRGTGVHIALLRGINVGGKNMLPMSDLASMFQAAGCEDVKTHIQSGNVICKASPALARTLSTTLEAAILERFGYHIPVVMRTAQELRDAATSNPFLRAGADVKALHVGFLADAPFPDRLAALDPGRSPLDEFLVRGREVYFRLPNGVARTKLTNAYFDSKLGTTITVRNWRTVLALVELTKL